MAGLTLHHATDFAGDVTTSDGYDEDPHMWVTLRVTDDRDHEDEITLHLADCKNAPRELAAQLRQMAQLLDPR